MPALIGKRASGGCEDMSASGPESTFPFAPHMSAFGGKADIGITAAPQTLFMSTRPNLRHGLTVLLRIGVRRAIWIRDIRRHRHDGPSRTMQGPPHRQSSLK